MRNLKGLTYGAEYEFGDIWRNSSLPEGLTWNTKDYSIVSSTGIANDPKGIVYNRGGEINSKPTPSIEEQIDMFVQLVKEHPEAKLNHRTNLHLHIRVPGLMEDLSSLKKLLQYTDKNQKNIFSVIEPIPEPHVKDYPSWEAYVGAKKRFKRRKVSHQYCVPHERVLNALEADTVSQFFAAHAPAGKNGKPAWGLTTRAGINFLQLKETETIEFRHFTNTLDPKELLSCFTWVHNFVTGALEGASVEQLLSSYDYSFPVFQAYNHPMEVGYAFTNFDKQTRKKACENIELLRSRLDIETCSAEQVVFHINKIQLEQETQLA